MDGPTCCDFLVDIAWRESYGVDRLKLRQLQMMGGCGCGIEGRYRLRRALLRLVVVMETCTFLALERQLADVQRYCQVGFDLNISSYFFVTAVTSCKVMTYDF